MFFLLLVKDPEQMPTCQYAYEHQSYQPKSSNQEVLVPLYHFVPSIGVFPTSDQLFVQERVTATPETEIKNTSKRKFNSYRFEVSIITFNKSVLSI